MEGNFFISKNLKRFATPGNILFLLLIISSMFLRLHNLTDIPLAMDRHSFRQTHTAITIQDWFNYGYNLLNYRVPVFGPPWQVPMEFPIYQTTVYVVMLILGKSNIELWGRLVSIGYFYLSALVLFIICRIVFKKPAIARYILMFYLFCPFNLFWSRAVLPDFTSVFFGLCYVLFVYLWMLNPKIRYYIPAFISAVLGYLCKSVSMFPAIFLLATFILYSLYNSFIEEYDAISYKAVINFFQKNFFKLIALFLLCVLPVIAGVWWVHYSDAIKLQTPYVTFVTSEALALIGWNYGTIEQRMSFSEWNIIFKRISEFFFPYVLIILFPFSVYGSYKSSDIKERLFLYSGIFAPFATLLVVFNLYKVHDYYLIALSPYITIFGGFGLYYLLHQISFKKYLLKSFLCLFMCISLLLPVDYIEPLIRISDIQLEKHPLYYRIPIANYLKEITESDEYVLVGENDGWSSAQLFAANRRGYMLRYPQGEFPDEPAFLKESNFTTMVTANAFAHTEILSNYKYLFQMDSVKVQSSPHPIWYFFKMYDNQSDFDNMLSGCISQAIRLYDISVSNNITTRDTGELSIESTGENSFIQYDMNESSRVKYIEMELKEIKKNSIITANYAGAGNSYNDGKAINIPVFPERNSYIVKLPDDSADINSLRLTFPQGRYTVTSITLYNN